MIFAFRSQILKRIRRTRSRIKLYSRFNQFCGIKDEVSGGKLSVSFDKREGVPS